MASFDCGHSELNAYLRTQARQEMDRGSASVSVLVSVYVLVLPMKTIGTLTESSSSSSSYIVRKSARLNGAPMLVASFMITSTQLRCTD